MSNFFTSLNIYINRFLTLMGLRRLNRRWGIIYDSVNKDPLDPVIVKLIDARTGKVAQASVSDLAGRYNFLAYPGRFKILVKKSNYNYPSVLSAGGRDEVYDNLYHGEFFDLKGESDVIPFNIPMDPVNADWNQQAKQGMAKSNPYVENLFYRMASALFWAVLVLDLVVIYLSPATYAFAIGGFYIFVFLLLLFVPRPRWWGRVWFKESGSPASGMTVEMSYADMAQVTVAKANIYDDGKFFLRMDPGRYLLQIKKTVEGQGPQTLYQKKVRVGSEGVINKEFAI